MAVAVAKVDKKRSNLRIIVLFLSSCRTSPKVNRRISINDKYVLNLVNTKYYENIKRIMINRSILSGYTPVYHYSLERAITTGLNCCIIKKMS